MVIIITSIHIVVCLFLILVVLVQGGNQGGVGAAFGGGNTQGVFGASGATSLLGKLTYGAAAVFMLTTLSLTLIQGQGGSVGLSDKIKELEQRDATSAPMDPAPAATPQAAPAAPENAAPPPAASTESTAE